MKHSALSDITVLTLFCAFVYGLGLTAHGLTNWQEAQRALVARDMYQRGNWIVPTVEGKPYLAKPPMIYWAQLLIARIRNSPPGEFDLRFAVAVAGWLGVVMTYTLAHRMFGRSTAWWSALFLASGILYVRSARIGEIDILLIPFTVGAIAALYVAWQSYLERGRTKIGAIVIAILCSCGAMLTKGPPGLLIIAIAAYGGNAAMEAWRNPARPGEWIPAFLIAMAIAVTASWLNRGERWNPDAVIGLILLMMIIPPVIATALRLFHWDELSRVLRAYARTYALLVLLIPLLVFYCWGKLVSSRIGSEVVARAVEDQTADNLRLLVPHSALDNLLAVSYGAGLGSIASALALIWMRRRRPELPVGVWLLLAWSIGGIVAFSIFGKGVPRYLTPIWPALAMLGGWWFATVVLSAAQSARLAALIAVVALLLGLLEGWWYGYGQEWRQAELSPRAMAQELLAVPDADTSRLATYEFTTPMLDYYIGHHVTAYDDNGPPTLADLCDRLRKDNRPIVMLVRKKQPPRVKANPRPAIDRLREAGFKLQPIPLHSRFTVDKWKNEVIAVSVQLASNAGQ